jgi:hypothetical protein
MSAQGARNEVATSTSSAALVARRSAISNPRPPARVKRPAAETAADREAEIRRLLEARSTRRARAAKPPLDVDAEAERRLHQE